MDAVREVSSSDPDAIGVLVCISGLELVQNATDAQVTDLIDSRLKIARCHLLRIVERKTGREVKECPA